MKGVDATLQNFFLQECYRNINMPQPQELCDELPKDVIRSIGSDSTIKMIVQQEMQRPEVGKFHAINLLSFEFFNHEFDHLIRTQQATQP